MRQSTSGSGEVPVVRSAALVLTLCLCFGRTGSAGDGDPGKAKFEALSSADPMIMVPMRDGVVVARNTIHYSEDYPTRIVLPVVRRSSKE